MKSHYFLHRPDITSPRGTIWRVPGEHLESALSWQRTVNSCVGAVMHEISPKKARSMVEEGKKAHRERTIKRLRDSIPARIEDWGQG